MTNIFSTGCQSITLHAVKSFLKVFPFPAAYAVCESVFVSPASNLFLSLFLPWATYNHLAPQVGVTAFSIRSAAHQTLTFPSVSDSLSQQ